MNTLQKLYDSEINWQISTFWDAGFDWWLGDEMNGYRADGKADTLEEAAAALAQAAREHFPDSVFAKGPEIDTEKLLARMRHIAKRDGYYDEKGRVREEKKLEEAAKKELMQ